MKEKHIFIVSFIYLLISLCVIQSCKKYKYIYINGMFINTNLLKNNVDEALKNCPNVHSVIVVNRTKSALIKENEVDVDYYQNIENFPLDWMS